MSAVLAAGVLFGMAALVVDLGLARDTRQQSQIASDSAAVAGANALYPVSTACVAANAPGSTTSPCLQDAVNAAKAIAAIDFGVTNLTTCSVPASYSAFDANTCISFDSLSTPSRVSVVMPPRTVNARFAGGNVSSVKQVQINTAARSAVSPGRDVNCGLCFLGGVTTNNSDFTVVGSSIAVNGNITVSGGANSVWTATNGEINVAGTTSGGGTYNPPASRVPPFADPYVGLALPSTTSLTNRSSITQCDEGTNMQPGIYGDLLVKNGNSGQCTLNPGLYVITGDWSYQNTNSKLVGAGVTLYFTCGTPAAPAVCTSSNNTPPAGGMLDGKNGTTILSGGATSLPATLQPFTIIYDRLNKEGLYLQGGGGSKLTGAIYAPNTGAIFNGTSLFEISGGPVVLKAADGVGNTSGIQVTNSTPVVVTKKPGDVFLDN